MFISQASLKRSGNCHKILKPVPLHMLYIWDILGCGHCLELWRRWPFLKTTPNHNSNSVRKFYFAFSVTNRKLVIQRKCLKLMVFFFHVPNAWSFLTLILRAQTVVFSKVAWVRISWILAWHGLFFRYQLHKRTVNLFASIEQVLIYCAYPACNYSHNTSEQTDQMLSSQKLRWLAS